MTRYKATFTAMASSYLYFEVKDGQHPGTVLDQLLESGQLEVPSTSNPEEWEIDAGDLELDGWNEE